MKKTILIFLLFSINLSFIFGQKKIYFNPSKRYSIPRDMLKGEYHLMTMDGKVISPRYDFIEQAGDRTLYAGVAMKDGKCAPLDSMGIPQTEFIYDNIDADTYWQSERQEENGLLPVMIGKKWGFLDDKFNELIPCIYYWYDGYKLIAVQKEVQENGRKYYYYGAINNKGEEVIPCVYNSVIVKSDSYFALVRKGKKRGVISHLGKIAIPFDTLMIEQPMRSRLRPGIAPYYVGAERDKNRRLVIVDSLGNTKLSLEGAESGGMGRYGGVVYQNDKLGMVNGMGDLVVPIEYEHGPNIQGGPRILIKDGLYYLFDRDVNLKIAAAKMIEGLNYQQETLRVYTDSAVFICDYQGNIVEPKDKSTSNNSQTIGWKRVENKKKYGYQNKEGEIVIPCQYDYISGFVSGYAGVKYKKKFGVIDANNNIVIPIEYDAIEPIDGELRCIAKKDKRFYFMDMQGNVLSPPYIDILKLYSHEMNRYATIDENALWGVCDGIGNVIVPNKYMYINPNINSDGTLRIFQIGSKKRGLIDGATGEELVAPGQYDEVKREKNGYIVVTRGGKSGVIYQGKEIFPCEYQDFQFLANGVVAVKQNDLWGAGNNKGEVTIPIENDYVRHLHGNIVITAKDVWSYY